MATWLALHRHLLSETSPHKPAEYLSRPHIEAAASQQPDGWTKAAAEALGRCYREYHQYGERANKAGSCLDNWLVHVLHYNNTSPYVSNLASDAEAAAEALWLAIKSDVRNEAFQKMLWQDREVEVGLSQIFPSRPPMAPLEPFTSLVEFPTGLRPTAQPFYSQHSAVEIDLSDSSFQEATLADLRSQFDQALRKYESTKSVKCCGQQWNKHRVRFFLEKPQDEETVREYQEWLLDFPEARLCRKRWYPVKVNRANKSALLDDQGVLLEDAASLISKENSINVARMRWLSKENGKQYGSAVIYLANKKDAESILWQGMIEIGHETAFTAIFEIRTRGCCFNCQEYGHEMHACQNETRCRKCGDLGHGGKDCKAPVYA